jgi:hypothetical protein
MLDLLEEMHTEETYEDMDIIWRELNMNERDIVNRLAKYLELGE